ncbi:DUF4190 domain-containing protein [Actinomadura luteofluorescens]|uniref:DUF4190 domain-containing protein n=1 Tax=Actinomadura luteofluorescens TaxID=46163 RepID=A0A7Y9EBP5_9ACTN|nr:DUF4190 domain-containing protein [Actinomadura luteofluorescens]NYD44697.1 hypothetical protein [Actinomadura luteofluorescens]
MAYFPAPPPHIPPPARNGMATAALVLGILGFFTCGFTSLFAVVLGHIAAGQIRRTGQFGRGSALAGALLGWLLILVVPVAFVAFIFVDPGAVNRFFAALMN